MPGTDRIAAIQHKMADPLRVASRVGGRDRTALRNTEQCKAIQPLCVDHRFQISDEGFQRDFLDIPIGKAVAAGVVADQLRRMRWPQIGLTQSYSR